jgi:hypothetical protein
MPERSNADGFWTMRLRRTPADFVATRFMRQRRLCGAIYSI